MKTLINTKIARIGLILGGSCCLFMSSCQMSEGRGERRGQAAGTIGGAITGAAIMKNNGRSTSDVITGGIFGAGIGNRLGGAIGRKAAAYKGIENVGR